MQKNEPIRINKILESARGESCTLNFDGCKGRHGVVFCHSNYNFHGHSMGQKADDIFGCYGCTWCHDLLDGRRQTDETRLKSWPEFKYDKFYRAMCETWRILIRKGVLR